MPKFIQVVRKVVKVIGLVDCLWEQFEREQARKQAENAKDR
jgi:hypothetical protein